jgi:hypothetical protein
MLFQAAAPSLEPTALKTLDHEGMLRLFDALGKGFGIHDVPIIYLQDGAQVSGTIKGCRYTAIPDEFKDDQVCST